MKKYIYLLCCVLGAWNPFGVWMLPAMVMVTFTKVFTSFFKGEFLEALSQAGFAIAFSFYLYLFALACIQTILMFLPHIKVTFKKEVIR